MLDTGEITHVGCNALRVNDKILQTALYDIITQILKPQKQRLIEELRAEIIRTQQPQDNSKKIANIEKQIEAINQELDKLVIGYTKGLYDDDRLGRISKAKEQELAALRGKLVDLQTGNSAVAVEKHINACIAELERIVNLEDKALNEGLYERITKKIVVYPLNVLEIYLSFKETPFRLQYSTSGRGALYKVEFNLLSSEQFEELMKAAPRNEIQEAPEQ